MIMDFERTRFPQSEIRGEIKEEKTERKPKIINKADSNQINSNYCEGYYPHEGGGEFIEFLPPIEINQINCKKHHPIDFIYHPVPSSCRWVFAGVIDKMHKTREDLEKHPTVRHLEECYEIASRQITDAYSLANARVSRLSRGIYFPC